MRLSRIIKFQLTLCPGSEQESGEILQKSRTEINPGKKRQILETENDPTLSVRLSMIPIIIAFRMNRCAVSKC
jgi:hypothetical protein